MRVRLPSIWTLVLGFLIGGCALLRSPPASTRIEDRIGQLPPALKLDLRSAKSELRFNKHMVPYIVADNDEDAAFLMGVAHAHLRGFQLELLRRASQGRLSERLGPLARNFDHALRIFDFGRSSAAIEAAMPADTKLWMESFVRGLNKRWMAQPSPFEFESLGIRPEPWTLRELITLSRLLAADVNWISWVQALSSDSPDTRWRVESAISKDKASWEMLTKLFQEMSKSGSNSWVIASRKTANGAPLVANDPHVGILYPNLWLLFGLRSPSLKVVGLTLPGIPFALLGRNERAAWGGTNMRALSTEFYDVSTLPKEAFTEKKQSIVIRGWPDKSVTIRDSRFGPVLSDAKLFDTKKVFSVKWVGHEPSDEFTAFYKMNRARNFEEFHRAFASYGVSAQNFLYADVAGNIAHVLAMKKPERPSPRPDSLLLPAETKYLWKSLSSAPNLPYRWNPGENYLASANNKPDFAPEDLGRVFSPDDRIDRIRELVQSAKAPLTLQDMKRWQQDVHSTLALRAAKHFAKIFEKIATEAGDKDDLTELRKWTGSFEASSRGALVYAAIEAEYLNALASEKLSKTKTLKGQLLSSGRIREILVAALESKDSAARLSEKDLRRVWSRARKGDLTKFRSWGDKHSVSISHPFSMLPFVGSRYKMHTAPASGSFDTLHKRAHAISPGLTPTTYGATARHVSDLSDADMNEFVLFGGQDGWLASPAATSQIELWTKAQMIRMPMSPELIATEFPLSSSAP